MSSSREFALPESAHRRRLHVGAEVQPEGGAHFRLWAPGARRVEVVFEETALDALELEPEEHGYFSGLAARAGVGSLYRYRLNGGETLLPDPASRFQPDGPPGPSEVIDPTAYRWNSETWPGTSLRGQVLYEMHLGTFTPEGTWAAAALKLPHLRNLGVTVVEIMPIGDFPGRFGWGYDGVNLFAPSRLYGRPDDARSFVDRAHELGLAVLLDVVYNHLGPDGNHLASFSPFYFRKDRETDWGPTIDYDGEHSGPVREYFLANVGYWIDEFRFDGLRIDATQDIHDESELHILEAVARRVRETAGKRETVIIAENEPQQAKLVRPVDRGGFGLDGICNDDFHHSAMVALTGRSEAYYSDYLGSPQELISAVKWGYLYQGQHYGWQGQKRGTPALDVSPWTFVNYLQNHDQVANSLAGRRLHQLTSPGRYRALTALLLLGPATPMIFQGQEFAASSPFLFFADHEPNLAALVARGRKKFLEQFPSLAADEAQERIADPGEEPTFGRSKLDWSELERKTESLALHRDLLHLRRDDPVLRSTRGRVDGAVLGEKAFVIRFFAGDSESRLLVVNLGRELPLDPEPEPLLAPPESMSWTPVWSSEDPRYGGGGTPPIRVEDRGRLPAESAVLLAPKKDSF